MTDATLFKTAAQQQLASLLNPATPNSYIDTLSVKPVQHVTVKTKALPLPDCGMILISFLLGLLVGMGLAYLLHWLALRSKT